MIRPVALEHAPAGSVTARPVVAQGRTLIGPGTMLNPTVLGLLKQAGVLSVVIEDGKPEPTTDAKAIIATDAQLRPRFASQNLRHPAIQALYRVSLMHHAKVGLGPQRAVPPPPAPPDRGRAPVASAREIADLVESIPPLPVSFLRISEVVGDPHCTTHAVATVVAADQSLALRTLRVANSAIYALPGRVESIAQAVALIGIKQIRSLALASAVIDLFGPLPPELIDTRRFWEHSLGVGIASRTLGELSGERDAERQFSAGLLHDLGIAVLAITMPAVLAQTLAAAAHGEALTTAERKRLGFDHGDLGAALLERWGLPPSLSEPVANHHSGVGQRFARETACVHVGELLAEALSLGTVGEGQIPPLVMPAWDLLAIDPVDLPKAATVTLEQHQALVMAMLG